MMKQVSALVLVLPIASASPAFAAEAAWEATTVPAPALADDDAQERITGFSWYRCYVKVPDHWIGGPRQLWSESVTITIDGLAEPFELYVNGQRIGKAGEFPPNYQPGKSYQRFKVPVGVLAKSVYNAVALRVYHKGSPLGLRCKPPVIAGYFLECPLKGQWQIARGDDVSWAGKAIAAKSELPGAAYDSFAEASTALKPPAELQGGPRLSPQESLATMTVADDLILEQVLTEPIIAQPLDMTFDNRGRLWVVQYRQYPYPAGVTMVSRDKYYRAVYDKVPPAPPHHDRGADRITIHEDTDGDGQFDSHKVFIDGLNLVSSIEFDHDGVWVLNPPYLLYYPDRDHDDVPDGDPEVHLEGFGLEDTHSVANSLTMGPDGWLYFADGSTTASHVKRPDTSDPPIYLEGPGVWRYHPKSKRIELFADGGGNSFSLEFDAQGRLFTGYNGGNTRGFHIRQGGYYLKGGENKYGPRSNPYLFGELPAMKTDTPVQRFTHTLALYEDDALPEKYRGHFFCADPLHRNIILAERRRDGSTFATRDVSIPLAGDDPAFRPVDIKVGPDGAVYIADFYEYYIAHGQHFQGQIDPSTGRIYRLRAKDGELRKNVDFTKLSEKQLIDMLNDPSKQRRGAARRQLARVGGDDAASQLAALADDPERRGALDAYWTLHLMGRFDDAPRLRGLTSPHPDIRRWAIPLLVDHEGIAFAHLTVLKAKAATETDVQVRAQFAETARSLLSLDNLATIRNLLSRDIGADDPHLPLMIWWAVESLMDEWAAHVVAMLNESSLRQTKMVRDHLLERAARRLASTGRRADLVLCAQLFEASTEQVESDAILRGLTAALRGRSLASAPPELAKQLKRLGQTPLVLRLRLGEEAAVAEAVKTLGDAKADEQERIALAAALGEMKADGAKAALIDAATAKQTPLELRGAAMTALIGFEDDAIATRLIAAYASLPGEAQQTARNVLAARAAWAKAMLEAVANGQIKADTIEPDIIAKLRLFKEPAVAARVQELFPTTAPIDAVAVAKRIAQIRDTIAAGEGSPYAGRVLFTQRCANCHRLYSQGGHIGPDLTPYQRDDLGTMLMSIIAPSAEVREGYENMVVETQDGAIVSGFFVDRDDHILTLRGLDGQNVTLRQDEVYEIRSMGRSLMPEGLLNDLSDQQVRDLFAYLRSAQPIAK